MSKKQKVREHLERQLAARDLAAQALMRAAQTELMAAVRVSRELALLNRCRRET